LTSTSRPPLQRILEFGIYVEDVARSIEFYGRVFGLPVLVSNERIGALDVEGKQVLLIFKIGGSAERVETEQGILPAHDGEGTTHFAFAIGAEDLSAWEAWLGEQNVEIESKMAWERGGCSVYFRDPDGHLLELVTPGVWATY